jgi:hypothetical protein
VRRPGVPYLVRRDTPVAAHHRRRSTTGGSKGRDRRARRSDAALDGYCFFCGEPFDENAICGVNGTLREGQDCVDRAPELVHVDLCGLPVPAISVRPSSPAGRQGAHVAFVFCSKECANAFYLAVLADGIMAGDDPSLLVGDDHDARSKWIVGLKLLPEDDPVRAAGASVNEDRLARVMNAIAYLSAAIVSVDHADRVRRMTAVLERLQRSVPLHHGCSWCFRTLDRDQRTVPLYVALKDEADLSEHESGRMSMRIGGPFRAGPCAGGGFARLVGRRARIHALQPDVCRPVDRRHRRGHPAPGRSLRTGPFLFAAPGEDNVARRQAVAVENHCTCFVPDTQVLSDSGGLSA